MPHIWRSYDRLTTIGRRKMPINGRGTVNKTGQSELIRPAVEDVTAIPEI